MARGVRTKILHRYIAIDRRDAIQPAFEVLLNVVDVVLPVRDVEVLRAREVVLGSARISARDALHVAVMEQHGIDRIMTFDRGFDDVPGLTRVR